jgi:hypothetical protein
MDWTHITQIAAAFLLVLSALMLGSLIPGGPIENRNFSHIPAWILACFNVFLTVLGLGSLICAYFVFMGSSIGFVLALICGLSYAFVYIIDLAGWFPKTPDAMPKVLYWVEVIGTVVALPLVVSSIYLIKQFSGEDMGSSSGIDPWLLVGMVIIGFVIIGFATRAAMNRI